MKIPSVKNINVKGKKVLLRVDFNVPIKNGKVADDFRIKRTIPTINLLKKKGARIILISHLTDGRASTLRPVAKFLKIDFIPKTLGGEVEEYVSKMKNGGIVLLENLRSDKREEKNGAAFAKELAKLGDIFVNDAFSASHRKHASIVGVPKHIPAFAGLLFLDELKNLQAAFNPKHPFLLVLGGVKFGVKLGVLKKFVKIADKIFVGGALANNFFREQGLDIGKSIFDGKTDIKKYLNNPKVTIPVDIKEKGGAILDCGPNTIKMLKEIVNRSKFVLWNGPLGNFEKKEFAKGTEELAKIIAGSPAMSIIGGGDTIAAARKINGGALMKKFSFVSTAGGAMLEFLSQGTLPGIEALKR
ncbi:MAG: phosphoglycerate kinase [bacterium]|nr:phosphoglycerate kinase [bacterium]